MFGFLSAARHFGKANLSGQSRHMRLTTPSAGAVQYDRVLRFEPMEERALLSIGATPFYLPPQHNLLNLDGYLTGPCSGNPSEVALDYLRGNAVSLGMTAEDFSHAIITDQYTDTDTGVTHVYLRQEYRGLEVFGADYAINLDAQGCIMNVGGGFVPGLDNTLAPLTLAVDTGPILSVTEGMQSLGLNLGIGGIGPFPSTVTDVGEDGTSGINNVKTLLDPSYSLDPITAKLQYVPTESGVVLAWEYVLRTPDEQHWYDASVDAVSGDVVAISDWVDNATYNVYSMPVESPMDGSRSVVTDPQVSAASPYGWHDTNGTAGAEYTDTRGNNVFAQEDGDANNSGGLRPDGTAALNFDYPLDLTQAPSAYQSAAVTNLFYWNNICHDIHYEYGFNESAGNFQVTNYSGLGLGNDAVQADVQDGSGTNNANFATPPEGSSPRMQMFVFTYTSPRRDGDLQSEIIVHEYGHGVSNRLVGGPSNVNALNAIQSGGMGEGWSDWWGLMFTQKTTDAKTDRYPIGNYVIGQTASDGGIRRYPYSFDMSVDPLTYGNIRVSSEVHNVGEIWCSTLWDLNWLLIDKYGYNQDLSAGYTPGCEGNILALKLVMDSLKLMPSNPSFIQGRDSLLLADRNLTGGANQGTIWTAFARRGMGYSAYDGGSGNSTSVTEAFDVPMFMVTGHTPSGYIATEPASIDFQFSLDILQSSFSIADDVAGFTGPGDADLLAEITGYSFPSADTLRLTFNQQSSQGLYSIAIGPDILAANGFGAMDQNGNGTPGESSVDSYSGAFNYDAVTMQVASTVPPVGDVLTLTAPTTSLQVTFNEEYDSASIGMDDLSLSAGTVAGVRQIDATTVEYDLSGITSEQTLSVTMAAGAVTDVYGNSVMAFNGSYQTDIGTADFPVPLGAEIPFGGLVFDGSVAGTIDPAGDTDSYTINLDAGQTITALVDPAATLQPTISITGPGINIGPLTATTTGKAAILQTAPVATAGTYTLTVGGASDTTGQYTLRLILNAAVELDAADGSDNDTLATAQDIDASFIALSENAQRGAVVGMLPPASGVTTVYGEDFDAGPPLGPLWNTYSSTASGRIVVSSDHGTAGGTYALLMDSSSDYALNEAVWTLDLSGTASPTLVFSHATWSDENTAFSGDFSGHYNADGVAISDDGVTWHPVWNGTSQTSGTWQQYSIDLAEQAAAHGISLGSNFQIKFQQYDNYAISTDGRGYDQIAITTPVPPEDWYKFTLVAGESSTLALATVAGSPIMTLHDAGGNLLAAGAAADNLGTVINNFTATTDGTYYARVTGADADSDVEYSLVVTKNADFDTEPNNTIATAQNLTVPKNALGYLETGDDGNDYYRIHLDFGEGVRIVTSTPGDGGGEFINLLDPKIELYDPSGTLVASDDNGSPDGRNAQLSFVATATGDYVIRVLSAAESGEYFLSTDISPVTVTLPSDASEGDGTVLGAISIPAPLGADLVLSLVSDDPSRVAVPASVTIPAGQTSVPLPIEIVDNVFLDGTQTVLITATAAVYGTGGTIITIHDNETATLTVSLPVGATEGGGVLTAAGTVTADAAPTRDITISLYSDDESEVAVPATVILHAGQTSATFDILILDDTLIDDMQTAIVTAQAENWTDGSASIDVMDDDRTLAVSLPDYAWEGQGAQVGTVNIGGTLPDDLTISLTSGDAGELVVPVTVTIPAGQTSAAFDLTLFEDGERDGVQTVTLTADNAGFSDATDTMLVRDGDVDHFVWDAISDPQTAGLAFSVSILANNIDNETIPVYDSTAMLSAAGNSGALPIAPTGCTFTSGYWVGDVTVNALDTGVVLTIEDAGRSDSSNAFDVVPIDFPTSLTAMSPLGSLVYGGAATGSIDAADNIRSYAISLDAGQTITAMVIPSSSDLQPSVSLAGPGGDMGTATASDPGKTAIIQTATVNDSGNYIITVSGAAGTIGQFTLEITLNAAQEIEAHDGADNDTLATAQNIDGSFLAITGDADRGAVVGTVSVGAKETWMISADDRVDIVPDSLRNLVYITTTSGDVLRYDLTARTFISPFHLGGSLKGAALSPDQNTLVVADITYDATNNWIFVIDLTTNTSRQINFPLASHEAGMYTVAFIDNNTVLVDSDYQGSGCVPLRKVDLLTGTATTLRIVRQKTMLSASADLAVVGYVEGNSEPAPWGRYLSSNGHFATGTINAFLFEIAASRDGQQYAVPTSHGTFIFNQNLQQIGSIGITNEHPIGAVYSPISDIVFFAWFDEDNLHPRVDAYNTNTQSEYVVIDSGASFDSPGITAFKHGRLQVSADGSLLGATVTGGVNVYDVSNIAPDEDWYEFALADGESATVAIDAAGASGITLELYGGGSHLLASGAAADNLSQVISNFHAPTAGTYYARVAGSGADYRLVVTRNAEFDTETNNSIGTAQDISETKTALGNIQPTTGTTESDYYRVHLDAGHEIQISTTTPSDGAGEFVNLLDPKIELYDSTGTLLADDDNGAADGRNSQLTYSVNVTGDYFVRVLPAAGAGEYVLSVEQSLATVTLPSDASEGDGTVMGTISIPAALDADLVLSLVSDDPGRAAVPANVTIPAGQTSAPLPIEIVDNSFLDGMQTVVITATTDAYGTSFGAITIHDNETATLTVSLPADATEGDGVLTGAGTITASAAPTRDIVVALFSDDESEAVVPTTVILHAGQTSATFDVLILDDTLIDDSQTATVTARVENWTDGSASIGVLDNDRTLSVTLPTDVWEGQGTMTGAGTVRIGGTLPTDLTITLLSDNDSELAVPSTVTIPAGQTSVLFDPTIIDDTDRDGGHAVTVTATVAGFTDAATASTVHDNELDRFEWDAITGPKTAGVAFSATARAKNVDDETIIVFNGTAALTGSGQNGSLSVAPASAAFASGAWTDNVTVNAVDSSVTLQLDDGAGITSSSNAFDTKSGALDSFQWSTISSPQIENVPFPATVTAMDANGHTVTDHNGSINIFGQTGDGTVAVGTGTSTWSRLLRTSSHDARVQTIYEASEIGSPGPITSLAIDVSTVPGQIMNDWTIRLKHTPLNSYATPSWEGSDWTTVYQADQTISTTGWVTFDFDTQFIYDGVSNLMVDFSFNNSSSSSRGYVRSTSTSQTRSIYYYTNSSYGDPLTWSGTSPSPYSTTIVPNVRFELGYPVPVTATSDGFINGVWTGYVTALLAANDTYLLATDGSGHVGLSNTFDVDFVPTPDLTVAKIHAGDFRQGDVGDTYTITVTNSGTAPTDGMVSLVDLLPAGLTATAFAGDGWTTDLSTLTATRSDVLDAGASFPELTLTVDVAVDAAAGLLNSATVSGGGEGNTLNNTADDPTNVVQAADLTVTKTHAGDFKQGDVGRTYSITVSNAGMGPTTGEVSLIDVLPAGLTATAFGGSGWTTDLSTLTATRNDVLAAGASYSVLTLIVDVAADAPVGVINTATVFGGGEFNTANNTDDDPTTIVLAADLAVAKGHVGNFKQGDTADTYSITVSNVGMGPTSGTVTLADSLPAGLSATDFSGDGWTVDLAALTATRSDPLASGESYPTLTLTVIVAVDAPASIINTATVSGGGEINAANNTADDPTIIEALELLVTLPTSGWEGEVLSGAGLVRLATAPTSDLIVSLTSGDETALTVPATVTVLAGETTASFDVTLLSNGLCEGPRAVSVTATADGLPAFSAEMMVKDGDVHHFTFDVISDPMLVGVPFSTTVRAWDILDNLILVYQEAVSLVAATGTASLPVTPDSITFSAGVWAGDVTIAATSNNVDLRVSDGNGHGGTSNIFDVVLPAEIHGSKWNDLDADGQWDANEPGLQDWTIYLDQNNNGRLDDGETSTITAADGSYDFTDLQAGTYTVAEVMPAGWQQTSPGGMVHANLIVNGDFETGDFSGWTQQNSGPGSFVINDGSFDPVSPDGPLPPYEGTFSALDDQTGPGINALYQDVTIPAGTHAILSWADRIRNHATIFDDPIQEYRVEIRNLSDELLATVYSSDPGDLLMNDWTTRSADLSAFAGQTVRIAFVLQEALFYFNVHIDDVRLDGGALAGTHSLILAAGYSVSGVDFGNYHIPPAEISGGKWNDLNGDGQWDADEPGLPGWTIYLDQNNNGELDAGETYTITAADGSYAFTNLPAGTYTVAEVMQTGWGQTFPGQTASGQQRLFAVPQNVSNQIVELDPVSGAELRRFTAPETTSAGPVGLAFDGTSLFFKGSASNTLWQLDPDTGAVIDSDAISGGSGNYDGLAALGGNIYILDHVQHNILEFDPVSDSVTRIMPVAESIVGGLSGITGPDALIVTVDAQSVAEIDPITGTVTRTFTTAAADSKYGLAVFDDHIYVGGNLDRIDVYSRLGVFQHSINTNFAVWALGGDGAGDLTSTHSITVDSGQTVADVDFGNRQTAIRGSKWSDLDADGQWDDGEPGLPGWTIYLDQNNNGQLDDGEIFTTTDANGDYEFLGIPSGTYTVAEVQQQGWEQTFPNNGSTSSRLFEVRTDGTAATIYEVDPATGAVINSFVAPSAIAISGPQGLALGPNSLFFIDGGNNVAHTLWELDPDTGAVLDSDVVDAVNPSEIAGLGYLNGKLYLEKYNADQILVWDPVSDTAANTFNVAADIMGGLTGAGDLGVIFDNLSSGQIVKIDPDTGAILATLNPGVGNLSGGLAYVNGQLIAANYETSSTAYRIDPATGTVLGTVPLGGTGFLSGLGGDGASAGAGTHRVTVQVGQAIYNIDFGNHFPIPEPDLTVNKTHTGDFRQGDIGDTYTITVTNSGVAPTVGTVSLIDVLPTGLTATAFTGDGWTVDLTTLTATRDDVLDAGSSYPALTLTVDVAADAAASLVNTATVSGGGEVNTSNNTADDPTTVIQAADLTVTKTHVGNFRQGDVGDTYTIIVSNIGLGNTVGTISLIDVLPAGLTATAFSGSGWTTDLTTLTATRNDVLAAGVSYPALTLTVDVAADAPALVTNTAMVSGGGELNTANNTADDPTSITVPPDLTVVKTHVGDFRQGDVDDTYTIIVSNIGFGPTDGMVSLIDVLPTGLTATAISGEGWTTDLATLTATRSDPLAPGASYPALTLTVNVAADARAFVVNTAIVSGGGDTNAGNDLYHDWTTVIQVADLTVAKTHTGDFRQGDTGDTYTITVSNTGFGPTEGVVSLVDVLPAGLTATAFTGDGWTVDLATLTATRDDVLDVGASYPALTLTVDVAADAAASLVNTASVSGGGELNTANNAADDPTTVIQAADLTVTKTHVGNFRQGDVGDTYTIIVSNIGLGNTVGTISLIDVLPSGLTATAFSGSGWTTDLTTLTATRDDVLAAGVSYPALTLTVDVAADAPALVTNTATVSGGGELNTANNTADDPTSITVPPDLTVVKTHVGDFRQGDVGDTYTIIVSNIGFGPTDGTVKLSDFLPDDLTATAFSGDGWTVDMATLTATRSDPLAAGEYYPALTLTVNVAADARAFVVNTAIVSGGGDTNAGNDLYHDWTTVIQVADLTVAKTHTGDFRQGDIGDTYTITVTNSGFGPTEGAVSLVDVLPTGLTATAFTGDGWTVDLTTLTATRDDVLDVGSSYPALTLTVDVAADAAASLVNTASVSGGGELNTANNTADDPTTVIQAADLTVTKTHVGNFHQGDIGDTYTIIVSNIGLGNTVGTISLIDVLPAGLTATAFSGSGWTTDLTTLTATRDDVLAAGVSYPALTLTVDVAADAPALVTNTAMVSGGGELNTANNTADDPTAITVPPDLTVVKTHVGDFRQGDVGDTYTIIVSNIGFGPTDGMVSLIDVLPTGLTATAISGEGWTTDLATLTATRSDPLAPGASYPALTLTVDVAINAAVSLVNTAIISGGGELNTANNAAYDPTAVTPTPPIITDVTPSLINGVLEADSKMLTINFNKEVVGAGIMANYQLQCLGPDALLGTIDDTVIPLSVSSNGTSATLVFVGLTENVYRLTVRDTITNVAGTKLDGDGDGMPGGDFVRDFVVLPEESVNGFTPIILSESDDTYSNALAAGDFNDDGYDDLIVGAYKTLHIMLSDGEGSFSSTTTISLSNNPKAATVGDFNLDGKLDMAVGLIGVGLTVFLGDGTGGFSAPATFATASGPYSVITADFNRDGLLDLAAANYGNNSVSVLLGDGTGGFGPQTEFSTGGSYAYCVVSADFNSDGKLDLAVANGGSQNVSVLLGNGAGGFSIGSLLYTGGYYPYSVTTRDFNRDGKPDLAAVNASNNNVGILLNGGTGGFSPVVTFPTGGSYPCSVVSADFNGDDNPDLAVAYMSGFNAGLLLGNGAGSFAPVVQLDSGDIQPETIAIGDFDGDGTPDIALGNSDSGTFGILLEQLFSSSFCFSSPNSYQFDTQLHGFGAGQLIQGTNNAFDGLNRLQVGGADYAPVLGKLSLDDGDRTVILPSQTLSSLAISREITVPDTGSEDFARTIDVFQNTTGADISTTVRIVGNLGSDAATAVFATSDGDNIPESGDMWIGTDDADGTGSPAIIHYIHGPTGLQPTSVVVTGDNVEWTYDLTVPAGQTVRLAHYTIVNDSRAGAVAAADALATPNGFGGQASAYLTMGELLSLENFLFPPVAAVSLNLSAPQTNDVLTALATKSDYYGNPVTLTYVWRVNGQVRRTFTSATAMTDSFDLSLPGNGNPGDVISVEVTPGTGTLDGVPVVDTATVRATDVVGRYVFYNNSGFDGNNSSANVQDDNAIAPDKSALLPGEKAAFVNYTSYSKGINGVMVDFDHQLGALSADDFEFKVGNTTTPDAWTTASAPTSITVRQVENVQRVTFIWTDNAIEKEWLQVTVKATENTGLLENDVFYFGNAIGEVGNMTTNTIVNATDEIEARNHPAFLPPATIENIYDFNRDKRVNATDQIIVRNNKTFLDALKLITAPSVVTTADVAATDEDTALPIAVLDNDRNVAGDALSVYRVDTVSSLGAPLTINPNNTISYDPNASATLQALLSGESLWDTFTYSIRDEKGLLSTGEVRLEVSGADESLGEAMAGLAADLGGNGDAPPSISRSMNLPSLHRTEPATHDLAISSLIQEGLLFDFDQLGAGGQKSEKGTAATLAVDETMESFT